MAYEVDGVDVGGPRPAWADSLDEAVVSYPGGVRVTDAQHSANQIANVHPQGGVFVDESGALGVSAIVEAEAVVDVPSEATVEEVPEAPVEESAVEETPAVAADAESDTTPPDAPSDAA